MDGLVRGDGGIAQAQSGAEGSRRVLAIPQLQIAQAAIVERRGILEAAGHTGHAVGIDGLLPGFPGLQATGQTHPVTGIVTVIHAEAAEHALGILVVACLVQIVGIGITGFQSILADVEHIGQGGPFFQGGPDGVEFLFREPRRLGHVQQGGLDVFFLFGDLTHTRSLGWMPSACLTATGHGPNW